MAIIRFGVSLENEVLRDLDEFVVENNFPNRSRAIRYLVEKSLVEKKWQCNNVVAGAIVLLYDRLKKDLAVKLKDIMHENNDLILSSQHFHLTHDNCMEIIAVKGKAKKLTLLSEKLIGNSGIIHGKLIMSRVD